MNIKLNADRTAAVTQDHFWIPIDKCPPPIGAKVLLINKWNGVAVISTYFEKFQWTHWQGLPKFTESGLAQAAENKRK
jgi:hypothetical protein